MTMSAIRIGQGYDVHAFTKGNFITLGGVKIPHNKAFKAHSDGDVLLHAICDALLGALALGDIGQHFPDTDPRYHNCDSRQLLIHVYQLIQRQGYRIGNLDCTIIAQSPRLINHLPKMRKHLTEDLQTEFEQVSIKATTTEQLGFEGKQQGIAAMATVLLEVYCEQP